MTNFKPRGSLHDKRLRYQYYPAESGLMVKLSIHHRDGGRNYFSGAVEARGIEMSITTVECSSTGNGVTVESSRPMEDGNGRVLLAEMARYSDKKLREMVERFDARAPEISATWSVDRAATIEMIRAIATDQHLLAA